MYFSFCKNARFVFPIIFLLSDDGPESSFLGTKKPQNRLKFCGLVLFRLLLAGICPTRQVELEGLEPYTPNMPISDSWL